MTFVEKYTNHKLLMVKKPIYSSLKFKKILCIDEN